MLVLLVLGVVVVVCRYIGVSIPLPFVVIINSAARGRHRYSM